VPGTVLPILVTDDEEALRHLLRLLFEREGYEVVVASDGLEALVSKGIVDPKRACIVGASYGGYAALAGVTLQQGLYLFLRSGFSRIPVIGESVDDVLGVLYLKDVVRSTQNGDPAASAMPVAELMRSATFVPESKPVDDLLSEMQAARTHLVIVVDEYGGTAGLVTIEDLIEEIVGEIQDEYDEEARQVHEREDGTFIVTAIQPAN